MTLSDIDPERMKAASDALDKAIKAGGTPEQARAEFEAVLKGAAATEPELAEEAPADKPVRKPRSDKGKARKLAPPKPDELTAVLPMQGMSPQAARVFDRELLIACARSGMSPDNAREYLEMGGVK